jgi:hypothetical protein
VFFQSNNPLAGGARHLGNKLKSAVIALSPRWAGALDGGNANVLLDCAREQIFSSNFENEPYRLSILSCEELALGPP